MPMLTGKTSGSIFIDVGSCVHFGASEIGITLDAGPIESEAPGGAAFGSGLGGAAARRYRERCSRRDPIDASVRSVNVLMVTDASFRA